jgi:hypothetical protein
MYPYPYPSPYAYQYGDYGYQMQAMMYDPMMQSAAVAQQQLHYEGHKSRSNSLTHHETTNNSSTQHTHHKGPTTASPSFTPAAAVVASPALPSPATASVTVNTEKVQETTVVSSVPVEISTEPVAVAAEVAPIDAKVTEPETTTGWARGKALVVEQPLERQSLDNNNNSNTPDSGAGPSSWKRGISMSEKTQAQMLLRQDGILRFSREAIIALHIFGSIPVPPELLTLYGAKYTTTERGECKPLVVSGGGGNASGPKGSPNKGSRGGKGGRHNELIDEPHPDEKTFFVEKNENAFR